LALHFARRMAAELGWPRFPGFTSKVQEQLATWAWPGNVRELKNVVERALYRWGDAETAVGQLVIDPFESPWRPTSSHVLPHAMPAPRPAPSISPVDTAAAMPAPRLESITDLRSAVSAYEKEILECALEKHRHNQRRTAAALNLTYDQLRHALKRHGLLGE
jgi:psp operon transcriptional activator